MTEPLLEITGVVREFPAGDQVITALKGVSLRIEAGEMIAIMGASGSGKSTLMNILGCLDRPTRGSYRIAGRDTRDLDGDELAALRREHFGFIFQSYHLLPTLTAMENAEIPAIYAGTNSALRGRRAAALLQRLGLGNRLDHRPSQLSGGQQQRVSVARALVNGGQVILADEPTGALDSHSGEEMLRLLADLHAAGHTIIIVTHDPKVAAHAGRVIEISDGEMIGDRCRTDAAPARRSPPPGPRAKPGWRAALARYGEALRMALKAMLAHRLRTLLTMLGIVIGIASVVSVVALGTGAQQAILEDFRHLGTNTIDIYRGKGWGDRHAARIETLMPADADALAKQPYADSVTPVVWLSPTLRYGNTNLTTRGMGVGPQYLHVVGRDLAQGISFTDDSVQRRAQEVVIDDNTRHKLFPDGDGAIGKVVLLNHIPARIVGVTKPEDGSFDDKNDLRIWVPYTTAMDRILGQSYLDAIMVRVSDGFAMPVVEKSIIRLLTRRHTVKDFFLRNNDAIRKSVQSTTLTMALLITSIAAISLLVGGIGVMNIMLVSVTERTREIGVRMAVGARRNDILRQFLIEAVVVCLLGGVLGVLLALAVGAVAGGLLPSSMTMVYSTASIVAAFVCSTMTGVVFGFLPARNAARLDPVEALARE